MNHRQSIEKRIAKSPITMTINLFFEEEIKTVWEGLTDTEQLSKLVNIGPAVVEEIPIRDGVSERHIYWKDRNQRFVEEPYVWEHGKWYGNIRKDGKGPMKTMVQLITFTEKENGIAVTFQMGVEPNNNPMGLGLRLAAPFIKRKMKSIFNQVSFENGSGLPLVQSFQANNARLKQLSDLWDNSNLPKEWVDKLIVHVKTGLDTDLANIEPYELVNRWASKGDDKDVLKKNVLNAMLEAVRNGFMKLHWNLICPGCRGPKEQVEDLKNLQFEGHCESCNIRFGSRFSENVSISFQPQARLRKIQLGLACQAGPKRTPHQLQSQFLDANEVIELDAEPLFQLEDRLLLRVDDGSQSVELHEKGTYTIEEKGIVYEAGDQFLIRNTIKRSIRIMIQQEKLPDWVLTAAELIRQQEFIDHFSEHILAPELSANVGTITLMFSDLVGSTHLYQTEGDANTFAAVVDHFKILKEILNAHDGVLIKTVGDAIMAVFEQPENAVCCGVAMQKAMAQESKLGLRLGLHIGPCLAVTLNDRLDYFGATVNQAARIEGQCKPGQLVLSNTLFQDPEVKKMFDEGFLQAEKDYVKVKGIDAPITIHRVICNPLFPAKKKIRKK